MNLPPPRESSESLSHRHRDYPTAGLSPQDITDRRVDARNERNNLEFEHELSLRDLAGPNALGVTENYLPMASEQELQEKLLNAGKLANAPYDPYYGSGEYQSELRYGMQDAKETEEAYEHAQRRLHQQTMTREGQQGEADEMDAMGVPDMGRSVGGRAPPNVGRAGNSQMTFPSHRLTEEEIEGGLDDLTPPNPFPRPSTDAGSFVGGQPRSYFFGKSLDTAWSLLKALPEQREMAEQHLPDEYGASRPPVDMGAIHPGALSAMRRLQTDRRNTDLDTRSYNTNVGQYGFSPMPGRLMGTAADRALTRSGPNMPDEGAYYNPDTAQMEDQPHPHSERAKAARLQEILNRYN